MSGDWIKVELTTIQKPEVVYIAGTLGIDPDAVIGKLMRVWVWFDQHTKDGKAVGVTYAFVDALVNKNGFAESMALAGWLKQSGHVLVLPNFSRHNGETAKKRALKTERQRKWRGKNVDASVDAFVDASASTREEKRREEVQQEAKSKEAAGAASPEETLWRVGVKVLVDAGSSDASARTFLGRCVSQFKVPATLQALEAAIDAKSGDPKAYITKVLQRAGNGRDAPTRSASEFQWS